MRRILVGSRMLTMVLVGCGDDRATMSAPTGRRPRMTPPSRSYTTEAVAEPAEFDVTSVDFGYELATDEVPAGPVNG